MKTNTLTGADLNRAVAMALGLVPCLIEGSHWPNKPAGSFWAVKGIRHEKEWMPIPDYAGDIAAAWPIIEREFICLNGDDGAPGTPPSWTASIFNDGETKSEGPTAQIAAMRCFVASVFGDDVELP